MAFENIPRYDLFNLLNILLQFAKILRILHMYGV